MAVFSKPAMLHYLSALVVVSQILLTTAAPAGDCPRRLKRQSNGALIQGDADLVGDNDPNGVLVVGNEPFFGDGIDGGGQGELSTGEFGPFFDGDIINGDLGDFFSTGGAGGEGGEGGEGALNTELGGAKNRVFSTTGVGVRLVASFTVTDLATIVTDGSLAAITGAAKAQSSFVAPPTPTPAPALGTSVGENSIIQPSSSSSNIGGRVANQGNPSSGVGFRVVTIESVGSEAVASATSAAASEINAAGGSVSATGVASAPPPASSTAGAGTSSAGASFAPTTTGIAAQQLGFQTTSTSIDFAALSSSIAGSSASPSPLAANEQQAAVQIPGQKLSVLPIGLGVFGGLALLALLVVGWVTYERKKYRRQFRNRKATENVQNALNSRRSRMGIV